MFDHHLYLFAGYTKILLSAYEREGYRKFLDNIENSQIESDRSWAKPATVHENLLKDQCDRHLQRQASILPDFDCTLETPDLVVAASLLERLKGSVRIRSVGLYPIVAYSGGLDSMFAAKFACHIYGTEDVRPVHLNYRGPYSAKERELSVRAGATIIDFPQELQVDPGMLVDGYILPGRNGFIALAIALVAGKEHKADIVMTSHYRSDSGQLVGAIDKNLRFFDELSSIMRIPSSIPGGNVVSLTSNMSKPETMLIARELWDNDEDLIEDIKQTSSCYSEDHPACGECSACFKRWQALDAARLDVVDEWRIHPKESTHYYAHLHREAAKGRNSTSAVEKQELAPDELISMADTIDHIEANADAKIGRERVESLEAMVAWAAACPEFELNWKGGVLSIEWRQGLCYLLINNGKQDVPAFRFNSCTLLDKIIGPFSFDLVNGRATYLGEYQ